ncbi:MAG: hypothetical protein D6B26_00615 [Spirochaetaceae bacterium]|nr:MAG: hypothetical protein D6B26_00615 [Spirochaetaceae bacterium]
MKHAIKKGNSRLRIITLLSLLLLATATTAFSQAWQGYPDRPEPTELPEITINGTLSEKAGIWFITTREGTDYHIIKGRFLAPEQDDETDLIPLSAGNNAEIIGYQINESIIPVRIKTQGETYILPDPRNFRRGPEGRMAGPGGPGGPDALGGPAGPRGMRQR